MNNILKCNNFMQYYCIFGTFAKEQSFSGKCNTFARESTISFYPPHHVLRGSAVYYIFDQIIAVLVRIRDFFRLSMCVYIYIHQICTWSETIFNAYQVLYNL